MKKIKKVYGADTDEELLNDIGAQLKMFREHNYIFKTQEEVITIIIQELRRQWLLCDITLSVTRKRIRALMHKAAEQAGLEIARRIVLIFAEPKPAEKN